LSDEFTKIVLVLEYDGTNYCGFQFQINAPTVQDEIEKALLKLTGQKIRVVAASRTDTGVHARGQVISFKAGTVLKPETYVEGLNYYLPPDIAVKASYKVHNEFHVQHEAISREYQYWILNSWTRSPLKNNFTYQVKGEIDLEAINRAGQVLLGEHDLVSFVTELSQSSVRSTFRNVYKAQMERRNDLIIFNMVANSFLPHQVRNTVGTLIRVGLGKISVDDFKSIMEAKKPGLAGPTVPAQGLYLIKVNYPRPLGDYNEDL
jgi:tRNA pseudouridine38-40 synthase